MNLETLKNMFKTAKELNFEYIAIKIEMGMNKAEIIINEKENFDQKIEYYEKAYNNDLTLKTFKQIKIIDCIYGNSLKEIEYRLLRKNKNL